MECQICKITYLPHNSDAGTYRQHFCSEKCQKINDLCIDLKRTQKELLQLIKENRAWHESLLESERQFQIKVEENKKLREFVEEDVLSLILDFKMSATRGDEDAIRKRAEKVYKKWQIITNDPNVALAPAEVCDCGVEAIGYEEDNKWICVDCGKSIKEV